MSLQVFPELYKFLFEHAPLSTLLADTDNQGVSHGNLPGVSNIDKNALPLFIVPYIENSSKIWVHSL